MVQVKICTQSEIENALLTAGVPFGKGEYQRGGGLRLAFDGRDLPLWWEERATWPDGSVKWIFLHTRVPAGANELVLSTTGAKSDCIASDEVEFVNGRLQLGEVTLEISEEGWSFKTPDGSWELAKDSVVSEPELELVRTPWQVELVEASPIAPLIRLKPNDSEEGLRMDQFLRLDPVGKRLIWQRRMTWHKPGKYHLLSAGASLIPGRLSDEEGSLLIIEPGKVRTNGAPVVEEYPEGRWDGKGHSLWVEKAWQRSPLEIAWDKSGVQLSFYPDKVKPLPVLGGTSFRHTVHLTCGEKASDVAGSEVAFSIDPAHVCKSEAMGLLTPSAEDTEAGPDFPGFEKALKATYESGRLSHLSTADSGAGPVVPLEEESRQDRDYFGLQHYGDWPMPWGAYGGEKRMYAVNEYDVAYAYFQGFARYGDPRFLEVAKHSAIHMTDVDWISLTGDMRFHGYSETAEDHGHARSATGEVGHYWTDGYWMLYFLNGDVWAKESAEGVTTFLLDFFAEGGEEKKRAIWLSCERQLGWPIIALMGSCESIPDERIIQCVREITAYIDQFTADPDREIEEEKGTKEHPISWWRTAMQDGCKPFCVGVVMEGLERLHRATGDEAAARSIVNLARFLIDEMWLPHRAAFVYEQNAYGRGHRFISTPHLTPLFVRGLGYAYELTGEEVFREVSEKAFHACLWTLYDPGSGGKSIGMIGRSMGAYVVMLTDWLRRDQEKVRRSISGSTGENFEWDSGVKALLENGNVELVAGKPEYEGDALISEGERFAAARFLRPAATDSGEIELTVTLNPGSTSWLDQRCYIHLCDEVHNKSCVSLITFYRGIHLRIYDAHRKLIEVPEGSIDDWKEGEPHRIKATWNAPGEAVLYLDGKEVDRRPLDRPIGGEFTRLHIGHKPGNWRTLGKIAVHRLRFGS
jgi:hypothetical protein